ncbi:MAG: hypothetical protein HY023_03525 [Chloroflexi bacterium]|nr:hypothetical protein [Chloroflexota bacterium]
MPPLPPTLTTLACPNCKHLYTAQVEQIFDAGQDPAAKVRLLRGRFNQFACPNCRFVTRAATPIVYHDPDKQLLLTYLPMEMGLPANEGERVIGRLVQQVIQVLAAEKRKGYLFTPQAMLTLQGMSDRVLEADGVTPEMREAQRQQVALIQQMLAADEAALVELAKQNDQLLDYNFFDMLTASAEAAAADGDMPSAQRLLDLRAKLIPLTSLGQQSQAQAQMLEDTARELENIGDNLTQDKYLDLIVEARDDDKVAALIALARPLADYAFFQKLSERIDAAHGAERDRLFQLREMVLQTSQEIDAAAQARVQQTAAVIRQLLSAPDPRPIIRQILPMIDESFMAVLSANVEHAQKNNRPDIAKRLQELADIVVETLNDSAPPEIRLINELLSADSDDAARALLRNRAPEVTPEVLQTMDALIADMNRNGQGTTAERLTQLKEMAGREAAAARWMK